MIGWVEVRGAERPVRTVGSAHNGRDALRDAYEEALDLRQVIAERDG